MTLNEYQKQAGKYKLDYTTAYERAFGLFEEAGEVAGIFKRLERGDYNQDTAYSKIEKELGDVLWYLSQVAEDFKIPLDNIAWLNLRRLESRQDRGMIMGSGSDR